MTRNQLCCFFVLATMLAVPLARAHSPAPQALVDHSNFFDRTVYDLDQNAYSAPWVPSGLSYRVFTGVGFNLANSILLIGPDGGIVVVDTLGDAETVQELLEQFRQTAGLPPGPLPIEAIVYTHNHIDHTGGIDGYLAEIGGAQACSPTALGEPALAHDRYTGRKDCVEVISHYKVVDAVTNTGTVIGYILNTRSAYMYGNICEQTPNPAEGCVVNDGIGPFVSEGLSGFRLPSHTVNQTLQLTAAGIHLFIVYVPSETNDEIMLFVPDHLNRSIDASDPETTDWSDGPGLLLSAEVIQGPSFPNLYSLRGTSFRSPATWYRSVDVLRQFDAWCMVPSHGPPLCGPDDIQTLLRNFRDAIQYTHDQTLRLMYRGMTPDQMVTEIRMPQELINGLAGIETAGPGMDPRDYLRKFYGSVPQSVREIYSGYLGWYQADPVGLRPIPPVEAAQNLVALMGGASAVQGAATTALDGCSTEVPETLPKCQWAAELATYLVRIDHDDPAARATKARAFRRLASVELDPNWRNWYLTSAMELEGLLATAPAPTGGLVSPEIVAGLPASAWVQSFTTLLKAEVTGGNTVATLPAGTPLSMGFSFPDSLPAPNGRYVLRVRGVIAEYIDVDGVEFAPELGLAAWDDAEVQMVFDRGDLLSILRQQAASIEAGQPQKLADIIVQHIEAGDIQLSRGTTKQAGLFFALFDDRPFELQRLTVR